ncbi:MAG: VWA domain-containing protein, partial [Deltaproteobacteria bacterium]|nr:VWA domain-containing protein [Deltaproteobacteria bacterium]
MIERISTQLKRVTASRGARISILAGLVLATAFFANAKSNSTPPLIDDPIVSPIDHVLINERPRIEVVFALDTTGSMSGLIDGAKQKIWSIVNQMADANTTPDIRMGLIGYRDRGDQYITKRFALTDDIDALYANLQDFSAGGGGDGPESVNQALHEAVMQMGWSPDQDVYKVIFLVGDAPPHMDYQDDVPYATSVELATRRGIVINTIQCGNGAEAARVFAGIAKLAQGQFASISQSGGMVASHTPMDDKLSALNVALAETVVAYGKDAEKRELLSKFRRSIAAAPSVVASRLSYFSKKGGVANSGRADLVDALEANEVDLDEISEEALPAKMQIMSEPERESYVREKARQRGEIKAKITELARSRDDYLKQESKKRAAEGKADAFDDRLL